MIRALLTGLLLSAWMAPVRANDDSNERGTQEKTAPNRVFELRILPTRASSQTCTRGSADHTCRLLKQHGAPS